MATEWRVSDVTSIQYFRRLQHESPYTVPRATRHTVSRVYTSQCVTACSVSVHDHELIIHDHEFLIHDHEPDTADVSLTQ